VLAIFQLARGFPGLHLGATLCAALVGGVLVFAGLALTGDSTSHSYRALLHPSSDPSVIAREYKWNQALRDLDTHPFGHGLGTASYAQLTSGEFFNGSGSTTVDNGFLKVALEQGLVIMTLFAAALLGSLLALIRIGVLARDRLAGGIAMGAAGTLLSFAVVMMAEDATANPRSLATWVIVGLGLAVVVSGGGPRAAESAARSRNEQSRGGGARERERVDPVGRADGLGSEAPAQPSI
jgi:hypothetical protein